MIRRPGSPTRARVSTLALVLLLGAGGRHLRGATEALPPAQAAVVRSVDEYYNHLRALRTDFVETYDGLGMHKQETGTLLLSRDGGRMRWSYTEPKGKIFVLDGKYAWSYAPGDAQAQRVSAKQMEDLRSPLRLLLGHTMLAKELSGLTVTPDADGGSTIAGVPRGQEQRLSRILLHATPAGAIRSLRLEEVDGAVTGFQFSNTVSNPRVEPGDFVFTPPLGVPVVEGLPPI